jgi:hypothetical protein
VKSETHDKTVAALVAELSHYLAQHPRAADTLDGIAQWWVPARLARSGHPDALTDAVSRLVAEARLCAVASPDGQVIYRAGRCPDGV